MKKNGEFYFDHVNNNVNDTGYNITYVNGDETKELVPIPDNLKEVTISHGRSLTSLNGKVSDFPPMTSTVLALDGENVTCRYRLDFGKYWSGDEVISSGSYPFLIMQSLKNGDFVYDSRFVESENHFCLSFYKMDKVYYYVYNKNTDKGLLLEADKEMHGHPLGFDYMGRLVLMPRTDSDSTALLFCTFMEE